jgi:serine/threonine protein kinase
MCWRWSGRKWWGVHTEEAAFALVVGVLEAVAELHSMGICHLDLKPDNMMIKAGERISVKGLAQGRADRSRK